MLINLSSATENDPTQFSNHFSDTLILKPYSLVCLIGIQITRLDQGKRIIVEPNTTLSVRFTPYDIRTITYNAGGANDVEWTLLELIDQTLTLMPVATTIYNRQANWNFDSGNIGDHENIRFEFKWNNNNTNYEIFVYNNQFYRRSILNSVDTKTMPITGPGNLGANFNQTQLGGFAVNEWTTAIGWDPTKYTIPPNMANGGAHNMLIDGGGETRTQFIIGQSNLKGVKVSFGLSAHDGATYQSGPVVGTAGYDAADAAYGRMLFNIDFKDYQFDIWSWNHHNSNLELVSINQQYDPGEIWTFHGIGSQNTPSPTNPQQYFSLNSHRVLTNGLAIWFPLRTELTGGNTAYVWDGGRAVPLPLDDLYLKAPHGTVDTLNAISNAENFDNMNNQLNEMKATGYRYCSGYSQDTSGEANANSNENFNIDLQAQVHGEGFAPGLTTGTHSWLNGSMLAQRYTAGDATPATGSFQNSVNLGTNIDMLAPVHIAFFWRPFDDTAHIPGGTTNRMTMLAYIPGAPEQVFLQFSIANADAWDFRIYDGTGANTSDQLQTPLAARINITLGVDYLVQFSYYGSHVGANAGTIKVSMTDITNGGITYTGSHDLANPLGKLRYWAGIATAALPTIDNYSAGYISGFRLYEKALRPANALTMWDDIDLELRTFYTTGVRTIQYYWNGTNNQITPTAAMQNGDGSTRAQYCSFGLPNTDRTLTMFLQKPANAAPHTAEYYEFLNLYAPGSTHMPNGVRDTTLAVADYAGSELGLVSTTLMQVSVDFENPTADANENVLENRSATANPADRVMATLECDIDNVQLHYEEVNVELTNLPHRTMNGTNRSYDKTIYQIPQYTSNTLEVDNLEIVQLSPPTKCWIELNNPGELPLNKIDIQLSDIYGRKLSNLSYKQNTNLTIEIKNQDDNSRGIN